MQKPNEDPDLRLVDALIFAPHSLTLGRFSHAETVAGRTPDFRVFKAKELVAYCEVKSPRDDWLDDKLEGAPPLQLVGGLRSDPTFNRIARHIEKAVTQFDAVNASRILPNVLAFVNHDNSSTYNDLHETLTGMFHAASGERFPTMTHISEKRLGEIKRRIDLYAWIDRREGRVQGYLFGEGSSEHVRSICGLLALDQSMIKR